MAVSIRHVFEQGPVIRALSGVAVAALRKPTAQAAGPTPGPWIEERIPPRSPELLRDYLRHVGDDPAWYRGVVPPHLFPQWSFPLSARVMSGLPYPLAKALNAGCSMQVNGPIPAGEPLEVRGRLESIDDDGQRALITTRVITGTRSAPEALVSELRAFVPLKRAKSDSKKAKSTVPLDARELAFLRVGPDAGLDFAKLTGDFNPIHWVPAYARAAGFRGCILHGFSTFARAVAALDRAVFAGDPTRLRAIEARFTRPVPLPAKVGVYLKNDRLWVADAPGGAPYLEATVSLRGV